MKGKALLLGSALLAALACNKAPEKMPAMPAAPSPETVFVVLTFPGDDLLLHRETRELPELPASPEAQAKVLLQELFAGPRGPFAPVAWWPVEVTEVYYDGAGAFFVDLFPPPPITVGSEGELALQAAVATTLALNVKEAKRVQLLFSGKEVASLGHLDFSRPTPPRWDFLAP